MRRYHGDPAAMPPIGLGTKFRKLREESYYLNARGKMELRILLAEGGSDLDVIELIDEKGEWL